MNTEIPAPPRRVLTRYVLPVSLVAAAAAALAWTGWRSFLPMPTVEVVPVSVRAAAVADDTAHEGHVTAAPATHEGPPVQAPGWIEPSPFAVMVPALTPGIVKRVAVLEGERVEAGQVLVELVDDEQRIALKLAEATQAEVRAKRREMEDELGRKAKLVESGAASAGEVARLRLRIEAMTAAEQAADAERLMKELSLARTQVRAPISGVVLARLAVPGMAAGSMQDGKALVELYDPAQLQVRADVALADAGRIAIGDRAEIAVDVMPDRTFRGEVIRVVQQADIAKNTVQAKVRLLDPAPQLKPEMLARVKLFPQVAGEATAAASGRSSIWVRADLVDANATSPAVSVVAGLEDGRGTVEHRAVTLAGTARDGWIAATSGLRAGDLVISGASPKPGARVRVTEPWRASAQPSEAPAAQTQAKEANTHERH
jgi:RND family efflux transporter MFP subunit